MQRSDKTITDPAELDDILWRGQVCRLALHDEPYPYIVPLNYGYERIDGVPTLFFHAAGKGHKIDLIRRNPRASFVVDVDHQLITDEQACRFTMYYASVAGVGNIELLEDLSDKRTAMQQVMYHYSKRADWDFPDAALRNMSLFVLRTAEITGKRSPAPR